LKHHSINYLLIKCFLIAASFSVVIYLRHYGLDNRTMVTFFAFVGLFYLSISNKKELFITGSFVGLLWFYWIALSFRYVDLEWVVPFVMIAVALAYGLLFWVLGWIKNQYLRLVVLLFYFDYVAPFGFDWFRFEVILVDSFIGVQKWQVALFFLSIAMYHFLKEKKYRLLALVPMLFSLDFYIPKEHENKVTLLTTHYQQDEKWDYKNRKTIIQTVLERIKEAKQNGEKILLLPESVLPLYLNRYPVYTKELQNLSQNMTIVLGALYKENKQHFNSTYIFQDGKMEVAHKVFLVPFGETTDFLPRKLGRFVNEIFYGGAQDYQTAQEPTDFKIDDQLYRNAICYESTVSEHYVGDFTFMFALSNQAWYAPSIEPTLQYLVMKSLARKYHKVIFHSTNFGSSEVIQ
jgi:apolipoprotein N-acyltransferase